MISAFNSTGYYHPDEHYQIIQFAEYKQGLTKEVSWEYAKKMRSCLQPSLCMYLFSILRKSGIENPFTMALILRLITATLSLLITTIFISAASPLVDKKNRYLFILASYNLWFLPFINVRFSSETWSGLFAMLAIAALITAVYTDSKSRLWLVGSLLGVGFLCRFQLIIPCLSVFAWCHFVAKFRLAYIVQMLSAFLVVCIFGVLLDSWFYNENTIAFLNYVQINVFQNAAAFYGEKPWYTLILYILGGGGYCWGIIFIASIFLLTQQNYKSIFVWFTIPFLILHALSPHKEMRFLFPLVNFIPIILILAYQASRNLGLKVNCLTVRIILITLAVFNSICLITTIFQGPRSGEGEVAKFLYETYQGKKINLITSIDAHPFDPKMKFKGHFYKARNVEICVINTFWDDSFNANLKAHSINLLLIRESELISESSISYINNLNMRLKFKSLTKVGRLIARWQSYFFYSDEESDSLLLFEYQNGSRSL